MRKLTILGLTAGFMLSSLSHAQIDEDHLPSGWVAKSIQLISHCVSDGGASNPPQFDLLTEIKDERRRVRYLHFSRIYIQDSYIDMYMTSNGIGKLQSLTFSHYGFYGGWDTHWLLSEKDASLKCLEGTQEIERNYHELLSAQGLSEEEIANIIAENRENSLEFQSNLPKIFLFRPTLQAYNVLNCTSF